MKMHIQKNVTFALVASVVAFTVAADTYTWLASPVNGNWTGTANFDRGVWVDGNVASFGESSQKDVVVNSSVSATDVIVNGAYGFSCASGQRLTVGTVDVQSGTAELGSGLYSLGAFKTADGSSLVIGGGATMTAGNLLSAGNVLTLKSGSTLETLGIQGDESNPSTINCDGGRIAFNYSDIISHWFTDFGNINIFIKEGGLSISCLKHAYGETPPFKSGAERDGGVTYEGTGSSSYAIYLSSTADNAYNGPTRIRGKMVLALSRDGNLGCVPAQPTNNIVWETSEATLFANRSVTLDANRGFWVAPNCVMKAGAGGSNALCIKGTITGADDGAAPSVFVAAKDWSGGTTGTTILDPGEGRTNRIGSVSVPGHLRLDSGLTLTTTNSNYETADLKVPLRLEGDGQGYWDANGQQKRRGFMEIRSGAEFRYDYMANASNPNRAKQVIIANFGHLLVDGGKCVLTGMEVLNAYGAPGMVTVRNGGTIDCQTLRISHVAGLSGGEVKTIVNIETGGVVRCAKFVNTAASCYGIVNLNGGVVVPTIAEVGDDFFGSKPGPDSVWTAVQSFVRAGGAIFDTAGVSVGMWQPLLAGAEEDGGVTKKGTGTLTLRGANTYNGVTRLLGGTLAFASEDCFPGGDLEFDLGAIRDRTDGAPFMTVPELHFRAGSKVRFVVPDGFDGKLRGRHALVVTTAEMSAVPAFEVVNAAGEPVPLDLCLELSADKRTMNVRINRGLVLTVK